MDRSNRELARYFRTIPGVTEQFLCLAIDRSLKCIARTLAFQVLGRQRAEFGGRTVAQYRARGDEGIARTAIDNRVGATGVVADHSADHTAVLGGGFGCKENSVRRQREVKLIA